MFLLTSQNECVYQIHTRLGSNIHNIEPLRIQFNSNIFRLLSAKVLEEQEQYLSTAAQAAREAMNPADWVALRAFVKLDITATSKQPVSFTRESRSVGLGYGLALAIAFRKQLEKKDESPPIWFATGELYASGQVGAIDHLYVKCQAACNYIKSLEEKIPFVIFYPYDNQDEWESEQGLEIKLEVYNLGGKLLPVGNLPQALSYLFGNQYEGGKVNAPFKGLVSFEYQDQHRFFGRDNAINRLLNDYQSCQGLFVVTGVSGSGKSSIIKAGLIPKIAQSIPKLHWQVIQPNTFSEPKAILEHILSESLPLRSQPFWRQWLNNIWSSPETISPAACNDIIPESLGNYLWYIDQFEDVLLSANIQEWANLARCLNIVVQKTSKIRCIVSVRSEYLNELGGHFVESHVSHVLSPNEWQMLLIQQALSAGLSYEEGLVDRLIEEAINTQYALPAMQFLLMRMHVLAEKEGSQVLSHKLYEHPDIGGLTGAIASQAQAVFRKETNQEAIFQIFETFIGITSDGSWYAKRVSWNHLESNPEIAALVKKLVNAQLMVRQDLANEHIESIESATEKVYSTQAIRFAHDCLISSNSPWTALQSWMQSRREYLQWFLAWENDYHNWLSCIQTHSRLANQWLLPEREIAKAKYIINQKTVSIKNIKDYLNSSLKEDNRRRKKRLSHLIMLSGLLVISIAAGAWGWWEQQRSSLLLNQVRSSLTFLTGDLKEAAHSYLPTKEQLSVFDQVDTLLKVLEKNSPYDSSLPLQSVEHIHDRARVILQKNAGNSCEVRKLIEKSTEILTELAKHSPNDPRTQFEISKADMLTGDWLLKEGKMDDAWVHYNSAHDQLVTLIKDYPVHSDFYQWLGAISASHQRLGDWLLEMGDAENALIAYQEAFEGFQQLTLEEADNKEWDEQLTTLQINLADLYIEESQFQKAKTLLQSALISTSIRYEINPKHKVHKANLAKIHGYLGLLYSTTQKPTLAERAFSTSSSLWQDLYKNDSKNAKYLISLVTIYMYWADLYSEVDIEKEKELLKESEKIAKQLLNFDNKSLLYSRINSAILQRLGNLAMSHENWKEAQVAFQKTLIEAKKILASHPEHSELQRDIALIYSSLGGLAKITQDWYLASDYLMESLGYSQTLVDRYPGSEVYREDLYWAQRYLAELITDIGKQPKGDLEEKRFPVSSKLPNRSEHYWWRLAHQNAEHLMKMAPENHKYQSQLQETQQVITKLKRN